MILLRKSIKFSALFYLCIGVTFSPLSQAQDLYTTDDYLKGLSDEVSSPEYLKKAKKELRETEIHEQSRTQMSSEIKAALSSMYDFESLIRTKYPSSHAVYSKLPASSRILIFDNFKTTKKLSTAKRMIIEKYEKINTK